jgi:alkaline phosphatase D
MGTMPSFSRRSFLGLLTVSAAAMALPATVVRASAPIAIDRRRFPQSVASGDPRQNSVVLWTRVEPEASLQDLVLQVALDENFTDLRVEQRFKVDNSTDGCLKVRVEGLQADTRYVYRFIAFTSEATVSSPVGRTRTAPSEESDRDVRFAVLSCQDFNGRWYNSLLPLLDEELDFVLHLGDFVYETTGDPSFQSGEGRRIAFADQAGALALGKPGAQYFAASSLDNYRQLYREYRGDPVLQALLEKAPLIAIWDDHEFSDDCWQDVATFRDGRKDERDAERRRNAEQAWCEFMPADTGQGLAGLEVERAALFPNHRIWRQFAFGQRLALMATDFRSARPDHLVPEDAFPGAMAFDEPALRARMPAIGQSFEQWKSTLHPYIDVNERRFRRQRSALRRALRSAYAKEGLEESDVEQRVAAVLASPVAVPVLNAILKAHNASAPFFLDAALVEESADMLRGLSWAMVGKSKLFDAVGSRYFVIAPTYRLLAQLKAEELGSAFGSAQSDWLRTSFREHATRAWRFVASSVSFTPLVLDLRRPELQAPASWAHEVLLNVDHWDGLPVERKGWFSEFATSGCVLLSGDIHAGLASQHHENIVEFTTPAVSSTTLSSILGKNVEGDQATQDAGKKLVQFLDPLLMAGYSGLRYAQTSRHGVTLVVVGAEALDVRFIEFDESVAAQNHYGDAVSIKALAAEKRFSVQREGARLTLQVGAPQ